MNGNWLNFLKYTSPVNIPSSTVISPYKSMQSAGISLFSSISTISPGTKSLN